MKIRFKEVSKQYGAKMALYPLSLELSAGKTHVLLGSSGCGKSTLLRLICGLLEPTRGFVEINGQKIVTETAREFAQKIGYVIQEGGLFPHLTASENVSLAAKVRGWNRQKINHRLSELSSMVKIESSLLSKYPKQLSGGQRQRVSLMRALMLDPEILLLDEPLGALDPLVRSHLQQELKSIFNELHKTVILVTHDVWEGAFFGHSISLFDGGHLIQHGDFKDLLKSPATPFVESFVKAQLPPKELIELL